VASHRAALLTNLNIADPLSARLNLVTSFERTLVTHRRN
jgi:hypothetical protein